MTKKERYQYILDYYRGKMPEVTTELNFGSVFQLLVATVLSAQCTDKRINQVTPQLFKRYPDAAQMSQASVEDVFEYIRSVSYPNAKSRHLVALAQMIMTDFQGEVPDNTKDLVKLPGVGRKTANVVQAVWFGKAKIAVDTHVYRVSHRLGLVSTKSNTPLKVENELMRHIPSHEISNAHHWLLLHGRYICQSLKPKCGKCPFDSFCPKMLNDSKLG